LAKQNKKATACRNESPVITYEQQRSSSLDNAMEGRRRRRRRRR